MPGHYIFKIKTKKFSAGDRFEMGNFNSKMLSLPAQYLQFLETDKKDTEEISKEFYCPGCNYNINAGDEFTAISLTGLQENYENTCKGINEYGFIENCFSISKCISPNSSSINEAPSLISQRYNFLFISSC